MCVSLLDVFIISILDDLVTRWTDDTHETLTLGAPDAAHNHERRSAESTTFNPKIHACQDRGPQHRRGRLEIPLRRLQVAASLVSASPAGAGLVMSLDSGRVVVGAGYLLALSFDAVAGTDLGGQTCGCVGAEVDRRAAGDQVAQMSVQPVECSAPFAGQFVAADRQQPEHAPVVICADLRGRGRPRSPTGAQATAGPISTAPRSPSGMLAP